jgi:hypothetical protein
MSGIVSRCGFRAALAFVATFWSLAAQADGLSADAPLVVDQSSHVIVMEYEAWWGPNAITFQNTAAKPVLRSKDMTRSGGGYDSADPAVIAQHVAWLEAMGFDAAISEITNNVSCTFNSEWFIQKYLEHAPGDCPAFHRNYLRIRDNTGNLYGAWTALGTKLKLIPMVGGIDDNVLIKDSDGKTAFEKEILYFGHQLKLYPNRAVLYEGKPLMLIYVGAAQDPDLSHHPLWDRIRKFLKARPALANAYTFRMMAGFLDSQPPLWASSNPAPGPRQINPAFGFWSWVDRENASCTGALCPYYPTYNTIQGRAENFTVSIATVGQNGWGCPNPTALPYCSDDALRLDATGNYGTLAGFMSDARAVNPIFLIVHQFNEFVPPDEGFDANTDDDIEPADLWGTSAIEAVAQQISAYRKAVGD